MFANPVFTNPWRYVCKAILYGRWNEKRSCFLRVHMNSFKRFRAFQIELEFGSVGFWGEGKTGVPREKPLGARERTNNKLNPQFPHRLLVLDSSDLWIRVEIDYTVCGCADTCAGTVNSKQLNSRHVSSCRFVRWLFIPFLMKQPWKKTRNSQLTKTPSAVPIFWHRGVYWALDSNSEIRVLSVKHWDLLASSQLIGWQLFRQLRYRLLGGILNSIYNHCPLTRFRYRLHNVIAI